MNSKQLYVFASLCLGVASAALAQAPAQPQPPSHVAGKHAADIEKRWAEADLDKDGQLTKAEAQVAGLRRLVDNFEALDSNKDGKLSPSEARAGMPKRPAPAAGGKPTADGKPAGDEGRRPPPPGGFKSPDERRAAMEERFKKADTNGDGALSKSEAQAAGNTRLLDHFDAIDANKDGKVTPEELRSFWQQRQGVPRK